MTSMIILLKSSNQPIIGNVETCYMPPVFQKKYAVMPQPITMMR